MSTEQLVIAALLTAIVAVLQFTGATVRFGIFSVTFVLIPIVIGAAMCGVGTATWLGFVFGIVVLLSGDASVFLAIDIFGTVVTVLAKGMLAGLAAGLVYKVLERVNKYLAVILAAIVCPIVNTGVFLIGCRVFFFETITEWSQGYASVGAYMILVLVGANFLFEMATNIILSPTVVRLLNIKKKKKNK